MREMNNVEIHPETATPRDDRRLKLDILVENLQTSLQLGHDIIDDRVQDLGIAVNETDASAKLLAPAQVVVKILEALEDLHPAIAVISLILQSAINTYIHGKQNDVQIATVFFTMSYLLSLIPEMRAIFRQQDGPTRLLDGLLDNIQKTSKDFASLCEVYYRENKFKRLIRSGRYKEKLSSFSTAFICHREKLRELVQVQGASKLINIQLDVRRLVTYIERKSLQEAQVAQFVEQNEIEPEALLRDNTKLEVLAGILKEKLDIQDLRLSLRVDLNQALETNAKLYSLHLDQVLAKVEMSVNKLADNGPHEFIRDPVIRSVWKSTTRGLNVETRMFLDALYSYLNKEVATNANESPEQDPDRWAFHFLSKAIFHRAIGEGIDIDCNGFVSVHEVNNFMESKPADWTIAQWFAFWAAGPYITAVEYQRRIRGVINELEGLAEEVLPVNKKRMTYFCGITQRLRLIKVYDNVLSFFGETDEKHSAYEALENIRLPWRDKEMYEIKSRLEAVKYRLTSSKAVGVVINGRRIEQCIMCLVYLLLRAHLKIARLAKEQVVAVAEFVDLRWTWEYVFQAFAQRMANIQEVWRQQRLSVDIQVQCFSGGIFEDWYKQTSEHDRVDEEREGGYEVDDTTESDSTHNSAGEPFGSELSPEAPEFSQLPQLHVSGDPSESRAIPSAANRLSERKLGAIRLLQYPAPTQSEDDEGLSEYDNHRWTRLRVRHSDTNSPSEKRLYELESRVSEMQDEMAKMAQSLRTMQSNTTAMMARIEDIYQVVSSQGLATRAQTRAEDFTCELSPLSASTESQSQKAYSINGDNEAVDRARPQDVTERGSSMIVSVDAPTPKLDRRSSSVAPTIRRRTIPAPLVSPSSTPGGSRRSSASSFNFEKRRVGSFGLTHSRPICSPNSPRPGFSMMGNYWKSKENEDAIESDSD